MRLVLIPILMLCGSLMFISGDGFAQDKGDKKKEVTLKGKITCGKCDLMVDKACATVIVVTVDKKDIVYYFDKASHEKHHDGVCNDPKKGTVEATIVDDGKKKVISVKKLTFDK
jgi:Family of unknown function (DUF6370)